MVKINHHVKFYPVELTRHANEDTQTFSAICMFEFAVLEQPLDARLPLLFTWIRRRLGNQVAPGERLHLRAVQWENAALTQAGQRIVVEVARHAVVAHVCLRAVAVSALVDVGQHDVACSAGPAHGLRTGRVVETGSASAAACS